MSFEDNICASVVDIRRDVPKPEDKFFIDTNVWFWYASSHLSLGPSYQISEYPGYISKLINSNSVIYRCELILAELSHVIEKSLHELYEIENDVDIKLKDFRHDYPEERKNFIDELTASWGSITAASESFDISIDESSSESMLKGISDYYPDAYDLVYLDEIRNNIDVLFILTDDMDFATVPDITVFTANKKVLNVAKNKGLLVCRR